MYKRQIIALTATMFSVGVLTGCDGGVDTLPAITINQGDTIVQTPDGGGTPNPNPNPTPTPTACEAAAGSFCGSIGTGTSLAPNARSIDPWAIADWFAGVNAVPPLANRTNVTGQIDVSGFPVQGSNLSATFTAPATWPPATATDTPVLPVPSYITSTNYVGAYDPAVPFASAWTAGWTVAIHGNNENWGFNRGIAGTGLANAAAPVADGTCPAGTTVDGTFTSRIGALANDEAGLFTGSAAAGNFDVCRLPARFDGTPATGGLAVRLTNDNVYVVNGSFPGTQVGFGDDTNAANDVAVVLTVEAGTLIYGVSNTALSVSRGASIEAIGTVAAPIVMTGRDQLISRFDGSPATPIDPLQRGLWGGVVINGRGITNNNGCGVSATNCNVNAEFGTGNYGGNNNAEDSGTLRYVVIKHAGFQILPDQELNGLTLGAVGRGTDMQYIQVHRGLDDGVEFFGGSSFIRYLALTAIDDDSVDCDNGWSGGVQNVLAIQADDASNGRSNRGIECDSRNANLPVTFPLFTNMTILGPEQRFGVNAGANAGDDYGLFLTEGLRMQMWNTIVTGTFPGGCIEFGDAGTTAANVFDRGSEAGGTAPGAPGPHLVVRNTIVDCLASRNFKQD